MKKSTRLTAAIGFFLVTASLAIFIITFVIEFREEPWATITYLVIGFMLGKIARKIYDWLGRDLTLDDLNPEQRDTIEMLKVLYEEVEGDDETFIKLLIQSEHANNRKDAETTLSTLKRFI